MARYRIIHPLALVLSRIAMRFDIPWLFNISGALECYADECAHNGAAL